VDKIIFTGSPGVGRMVMAGAAPHLKPVILELGGKDPMVFVNDVSLPEVLPWAMRGSFQNCGQNCCGIERLFVYESVHDEFLDMAAAKIKALRQGVPLACDGHSGEVDCGSMVRSAPSQRARARAKRARRNKACPSVRRERARRGCVLRARAKK
jgi:aldehyde dehydrogenase (NAD+)